MDINYKQLLFGLATYIPGVYGRFSRTGGTDSARYCYTVWLRHIVVAYANGLLTGLPHDVAELGPGDSMGIGLAALISGVDTYHAFDVVPFSDGRRNLTIFDELVSLFQRRENIPDQDEYPLVGPRLQSYVFPAQILTEAWLANALASTRLRSIRDSLVHLIETRGQTPSITYVTPWNDLARLAPSSVDMIYSQAVLEHVNDLEVVYRTFYQWLRPGGVMSHDIDFTSHGITKKWNGHWVLSNRVWKLVRGNRPYLLNRQPYSEHVKLIRRHGFDIVREMKVTDNTGVARPALALEFSGLTDDDLVTASVSVQAVKKPA